VSWLLRPWLDTSYSTDFHAPLGIVTIEAAQARSTRYAIFDMAIQEVSEREFVNEVMRSKVPVLVEFGADWCGPCKVVAPELKALAHELDGKARVVTVDIDRSPTLARELGIQAVPTFVVFDKGRPVGAQSGALKKAQLQSMIEPFLPRPAGALKAEEVAPLLSRRQVVLVDTREQAVYDRMHLPGAIHIPIDELEARIAELHALQAAPVLYCRSGEQTKDLAAKLASSGTPVSYLDGGVLSWEAAGLPVQKP
jgi:thioredoxin 1/putative thioredoxin